MAETHTTDGGRAVPVDLAEPHLQILRRLLGTWLAALRVELGAPGELREPARARSERAGFERLLAALDRGELIVPDEEAREALALAAAAADRHNDYKAVVLEHDALYGLLALLDPTPGSRRTRCPGTGFPRRRGRAARAGGARTLRHGGGWRCGASPPRSETQRDPMGRDLQCAVFGLVLAAHPVRLSTPEIAAAVLGDPDDGKEAMALARAIRDLVLGELLRSDGVCVGATRAALHIELLCRSMGEPARRPPSPS